jgi:hypothetical protein
MLLFSTVGFDRFQWVHLNERLAYERISMKQKIRTEISAAKRETDFFSRNVELSKKLKRKGLLGASKKGATAPEAQSEEGVTSPGSDAEMDSTAPNKSDSPSLKKLPKSATTNRSEFFKSLFSR